MVMQGYDHFYDRGQKATASRPCPLWSNNEELHGEELDVATARAKKELALHHIPFKWEPTTANPEREIDTSQAWGRVLVAPGPEPVVAPAAVWPTLGAAGSEAPAPVMAAAVWPRLRPTRRNEWPVLGAPERRLAPASAVGRPPTPVVPVAAKPVPAAPYRYTQRL